MIDVIFIDEWGFMFIWNAIQRRQVFIFWLFILKVDAAIFKVNYLSTLDFAP